MMTEQSTPEEIAIFELGFMAGQKKERQYCNEQIQKFWRTFFRRDWTMEDIDALLLRVKEEDRP